MARDPATAPSGTSMITPRRRTNHGDASGARPTSAETAGAAGTATTMPLHSESSSDAAAATCCSYFLPFQSRDFLDAREGFTEQASLF